MLVYMFAAEILSPSTDQNERIAAVMSLYEGVSRNDDDGGVELSGVKYKVKRPEGMGVWLIASPAK
jgi:hypothetical protein